MARYFTPPTAPVRPAAIRPSHPAFALFRHYRPWDAGVNVWLLRDGTVTEAEPCGDVGVARTFHGGHVHLVDAVEEAALVAAGYSVVEGAAPVVSPGLPGGDYTSPPVPPVAPELIDTYSDVYGDIYGTGGAAVVDTYSEIYAEAY